MVSSALDDIVVSCKNVSGLKCNPLDDFPSNPSESASSLISSSYFHAPVSHMNLHYDSRMEV